MSTNPPNVSGPTRGEAVAGLGVGGAASTVVIYAFEASTSVDLPTAVEVACTVLIVAAVGFLARFVPKAPGA